MKYLKIAKKVGSGLLTTVLFMTLILMVFIVVSTKASGGEPEIFGYELKTVLSGSMESEFKTGSVIAVKPGGDMTRFEQGDVITFLAEDQKLITHRVIDVVHSGDHVMYETKGDNNNAPDRDLVLSENVVAEYTGFTIPFAGYIASFSQSKAGGALLLVIPGLILITYAGITIWQGLTKLEKGKKETQHSDDVDEAEKPV